MATQEQTTETGHLSAERRNALVRYLAILFAAAFILVTISLLSTNQRHGAASDVETLSLQVEAMDELTQAADLAINGKLEAAAEILDEIDTAVLTPDGRTLYQTVASLCENETKNNF